MRPLFRIPPVLPAAAMKTYHVARPITWWVFASCGQVDCDHYRRGWTTIVDEDQAGVIRRSGRSFTETRDRAGLVTFAFPPGQRCWHAPPAELVGQAIFAVVSRLPEPEIADRWHKRVPQREPLFGLTGGDWRGNPRGTPPVRFKTHRQFIDDFAEHQLRIADRIKRG